MEMHGRILSFAEKGEMKTVTRFRWPGPLAAALLLLLLLGRPALADADPAAPKEGAAGQPPDAHETLFLANQAYLDGRYPEAAERYAALIDRGVLNGHVFYNLGNCYVRMGKVGEAILNYRKATLLLPRDGDLKANLRYARSLTEDRIEPAPASIWKTLAFWYDGLNVRELLLVFILLNGLLWASALWMLFRESEWAKWCLALSLVAGVAAGISAGLKHHGTYANRDGVLLAEEVPVRAGFTRKDTTLFVLHQGAEFRILDQENGWWKISLPDGKKGWLPAETGGRVALGR